MSGGGARITGGELRGRGLDVGPGVRPTEGRVREALFSIWQETIPDSRFLDLFAGSGAAAFEALSRGASSAVLVEQAPAVLRCLERNVRELGLGARVKLRRGVLPGALRGMAERPERFEHVFADPPYAFDGHARLLAMASLLLTEGGELVLEHSARVEPLGGAGSLVLVDRRRYGESALSFYRVDATAAATAGGSVREEEGDLLEVDS